VAHVVGHGIVMINFGNVSIVVIVVISYRVAQKVDNSNTDDCWQISTTKVSSRSRYQ